MRTIATTLLITFATQANAAWTDYLPNFLKSGEQVFVEVCEEEMKDRLKAPTTYQRLDTSFWEQRATPIQAIYFDQKSNAEKYELFKRAGEDFEKYEEMTISNRAALKKKYAGEIEDIISMVSAGIALDSGAYSRCAEEASCPTRAKVIIKYTAENSFGTPLAGIFECVINYRDDLKGVSSRRVYVDGFTSMEWTLEALKR